jgi:hypothetical protein
VIIVRTRRNTSDYTINVITLSGSGVVTDGGTWVLSDGLGNNVTLPGRNLLKDGTGETKDSFTEGVEVKLFTDRLILDDLEMCTFSEAKATANLN